MSRLGDAFLHSLLVLLFVCLAAAIFATGAAFGSAVPGDEHHAPTMICEPLPDDSGRWQCKEENEATK